MFYLLIPALTFSTIIQCSVHLVYRTKLMDDNNIEDNSYVNKYGCSKHSMISNMNLLRTHLNFYFGTELVREKYFLHELEKIIDHRNKKEAHEIVMFLIKKQYQYNFKDLCKNIMKCANSDDTNMKFISEQFSYIRALSENIDDSIAISLLKSLHLAFLTYFEHILHIKDLSVK